MMIARPNRLNVLACVAILHLIGTGTLAQYSVFTDVVDSELGLTEIFTLYSGDSIVKNDGQYALCSLSGVVWHDHDGNGIIEGDLNTFGLAGVPVHLFWSNGTLASSTETKKGGGYSFKVEPGSFYVRLACPKDYKASRQHDASHVRINPTTQISEVFELSVDHSVKDMSAGCYKPPVVEGVVFSDRNTNSNQEAGENGVMDVSVELTKSTDTTFRLKIITDGDGRFRFSDLEPSDYALFITYDSKLFHSPTTATKDSIADVGGKLKHRSVSLRMAEQPTTPDRRKQLAVSPLGLLSGDHVTVIQGLFALAKVEGVVFKDENANGMWDLREKVLSSVAVTLHRVTDSGDTVVNKMVSDEAGRYSFTELQPGQYYVKFDTPPEYKHSRRI